MNEYLIKSLVEALLFLEFSSEDVVKPDESIRIMESIASILMDMNDKDKMKFLESLKNLSKNFKDDESDFLFNFGENFGLS